MAASTGREILPRAIADQLVYGTRAQSSNTARRSGGQPGLN